MNKPRVLIFIDWFSPGYKAGGPTTSNVNIVDQLHKYFDFYIITSDTDYHSANSYPNIIPDRWCERENCKVWYCSKDNTSWKMIKRAAMEAECPVWYINGIYSRYFSIYPLFLAKKIKPEKIIVAARGMLSPQTFTAKPVLKKFFLHLMRRLNAYRGVVFHGTNEKECDDIRELLGISNKCIPIANLPRIGNIACSPSYKQAGEVRLVSFARISPEKNTLYAIKVLKACKSRVSYHIYGQINSQCYWNECCRLISTLPGNISVEYKGPISPTEIPQLYTEYDVMFLPTTGENFGHAILESFINSRPVVISDNTPWRHLDLKQIGYDIPLHNQTDFTDAIDRLANISAEDFNQICVNCFQFSQKICDNPHLVSLYKELFGGK